MSGRGGAATLAVLLVLAMVPVPVAGTQQASSDGAEPVHRTVHLRPAAVLDAVRDGRSFELPTLDGNITVEEAERAIESTTVIESSSDGSQKERTFVPNVFDVTSRNGTVSGSLLVTEDRLRAYLRTRPPTWIEPDPGAESDGPGQEGGQASMLSVGDGMSTGGGEWGSLGCGDAVADRTILTMIYVDPGYRDRFDEWENEVVHVFNIANDCFADVDAWYDPWKMTVDSDFNTYDIEHALDILDDKPANGADRKTYFAWKNFDGSAIGKADIRGQDSVVQQKPECPWNCGTLDSPGDRAYIAAHEWGHNNDAVHEAYDAAMGCCPHEHRSIMKADTTGHEHWCWGDANIRRQVNYLGTSADGYACNGDLVTAGQME